MQLRIISFITQPSSVRQIFQLAALLIMNYIGLKFKIKPALKFQYSM